MTLTIRRYEAPQPPQVIFAGSWNSEVPYIAGMVVQSGTSLYQAVAETTGNDPATDDGTHWFRVYEGA